MPGALGLNIVLVEDDDAIREALVTFLQIEGYDVRSAVSAEDGFALLADTSITTHLLLSDYQLPGQNGTWLIREARALGYLARGASLLFTAHPRPSDVDETKVLRKPLDLDDLLREVEDALAPIRAAELESTRQALTELTAGSAILIDLILYISARSPTSLRAVRRLRALLDTYDPKCLRITVRDLATAEPEEGDRDRIVFTPTLVRRTPEPRVSLLGCDDLNAVEEMLTEAGVPRVRSPRA